jgi:hypothetical protein
MAKTPSTYVSPCVTAGPERDGLTAGHSGLARYSGATRGCPRELHLAVGFVGMITIQARPAEVFAEWEASVLLALPDPYDVPVFMRVKVHRTSTSRPARRTTGERYEGRHGLPSRSVGVDTQMITCGRACSSEHSAPGVPHPNRPPRTSHDLAKAVSSSRRGSPGNTPYETARDVHLRLVRCFTPAAYRQDGVIRCPPSLRF